MTSALLAGVDFSQIQMGQGDQIKLPDPVEGRVVHIDADFLAYYFSYVKPDETITWEEMKQNAEGHIHLIKSLAAATKIHLHLTPSSSDKGDRHALAQLKEYQANRKAEGKPEYLHVMREWLGKRFPATLHQKCEADDGMSSSQYAALAKGDKELSVIASKDKDLDMVPGLHLNWDTGEIYGPDNDFGTIWYDEDKKKVKGVGQKFFWAQMLMGDSADNISGLPCLAGKLRYKYNDIPGSLSFLIEKVVALSKAGKQDAALTAKVAKEVAALKPKKVGPKMALKILDGVDTNAGAFSVVKEVYKECPELFNWKTGEPVPWNLAFISEAQLLWMRKDKHNPNCVVNWFKEINS